MEYKELILKHNNNEITFTDLDNDNEMGINIENNVYAIDLISYFKIQDIIKMRDHLNYLITKSNQI